MEISYQPCLSSLKGEAEPYFVQKLEGRWLYFRRKADYIQPQKDEVSVWAIGTEVAHVLGPGVGGALQTW